MSKRPPYRTRSSSSQPTASRPSTPRASAQRTPTPRTPTPRRSNNARNSGASASKYRNTSPGKSKLPVVLGIAAAVVVVAVFVGVALPAIGGLSQKADESNEVAQIAPAARVSFVAVGDNLPDDYIGFYADSLAGEMEDGLYDYKPIYEPIAKYIQEADLAYIDQETHLGGDEIGPSGYPSFNTTDAMADAVVATGFDFVASATNHSYDFGSYGAIEHSLSIWEKQPVAFTGTAVTEEQYNRIATLERNGITFALLNYTYGVNGFSQEELPQYAVNFIDENRIRADVARAREQADVVLVAMHWGTELLTEADEEQRRLAQLLADLDVDVVLGSHPHVIGPMAWVENSNGSGHKTLVAYSLGNFLADHEYPIPDNVLEGMLSCDFVRAEDGGEITIENIKWTPLVCHSTEDRWDFAVYAIDDYTAELAKKCRALNEIDNPLAWVKQESKDVVGAEWFED